MTDSRQSANEYAIEETLARYPQITEELLSIEDESLILANRQQVLPSGRSDLVFLSGNTTYLLELKVVPATLDHLNQLDGYVGDYHESDQLAPDTMEIEPILLAPEISETVKAEAETRSIQTVEFEFDEILGRYTDHQAELLSHYSVGGIVTSVARLGLTHGLLYYLDESSDVEFSELGEHYDIIGKGSSKRPVDRVKDLQKVTRALGLTTGAKDDSVRLTDLGKSYVDAGEPDRRAWQVTNEQARLLTDHVIENPFANDLTYSLMALLKSVFELSRNQIPVPHGLILEWYTKLVGKEGSWSEATQEDVVDWIGAALEELQLLIVQDGDFYLTPKGYDALSYYMIEEGKSMIKARRTL